MFGRRLNEPLGKLHFWLTFVGVYCVFMPMHWFGLMAHSHAGELYLVNTALGASLRTFVTVAAILTVAAQALFLLNFLWSLWRGQRTEERNPWCATTLEWTVPSPAPLDNFGAAAPFVYRGAYEFGDFGASEDFVTQNAAASPAERAAQLKQATEANAKEN
jgi:cytochrome c oxidase subunit I